MESRFRHDSQFRRMTKLDKGGLIILSIFALAFEGDAEYWFNDLWDESIDSMAKCFEKLPYFT